MITYKVTQFAKLYSASRIVKPSKERISSKYSGMCRSSCSISLPDSPFPNLFLRHFDCVLWNFHWRLELVLGAIVYHLYSSSVSQPQLNFSKRNFQEKQSGISMVRNFMWNALTSIPSCKTFFTKSQHFFWVLQSLDWYYRSTMILCRAPQVWKGHSRYVALCDSEMFAQASIVRIHDAFLRKPIKRLALRCAFISPLTQGALRSGS